MTEELQDLTNLLQENFIFLITLLLQILGVIPTPASGAVTVLD